LVFRHFNGIIGDHRFVNWDHFSIFFLVNKIWSREFAYKHLVNWDSNCFCCYSCGLNLYNMTTLRSIVIYSWIFFSINSTFLIRHTICCRLTSILFFKSKMGSSVIFFTINLDR
jgi:hypothetical protein